MPSYKELISPGFCKGTQSPYWNEDPYRAMAGIDHPYANLFIFSDSFVLVSHSAEESALWDLLIACSNLVGSGIESRLYLRGAISFGKCVINPTEGTFLGKPIAEAYDLANDLEWIGVSLHPNCVHSSFIQRMMTGRMGSIDLERFDVPLKNNASCVPLPLALSGWVNESQVSALSMQVQEVAPPHRKKYENAIDFARHVLRNRGVANKAVEATR